MIHHIHNQEEFCHLYRFLCHQQCWQNMCWIYRLLQLGHFLVRISYFRFYTWYSKMALQFSQMTGYVDLHHIAPWSTFTVTTCAFSNTYFWVFCNFQNCFYTGIYFYDLSSYFASDSFFAIPHSCMVRDCDMGAHNYIKTTLKLQDCRCYRPTE